MVSQSTDSPMMIFFLHVLVVEKMPGWSGEKSRFTCYKQRARDGVWRWVYQSTSPPRNTRVTHLAQQPCVGPRFGKRYLLAREVCLFLRPKSVQFTKPRFSSFTWIFPCAGAKTTRCRAHTGRVMRCVRGRTSHGRCVAKSKRHPRRTSCSFHIGDMQSF